MFNAESFGSDIPANWEEICDFLNAVAAERGITDDHNEENDLWEEYWHGDLPGAPEPEEEQDPDEAFRHLYSDSDIWSMTRSFYDGGYRPGDEEDLLLLFRSQRDENNRDREEDGDPWRHTEETDRMLAERLCEEFGKLQADIEAAKADTAALIPVAEYAARIGRSPVSVRQKAARGAIPGAVKIGRDWLIPEDAPYTDHRVRPDDRGQLSQLILVKREDGSQAVIGMNNRSMKSITAALDDLKAAGTPYRVIRSEELLSIIKATEGLNEAGAGITSRLTTLDEYVHPLALNNPHYLTPEQFAEKMGKPLDKVQKFLEMGRFSHAVRLIDSWLIPDTTTWPI